MDLTFFLGANSAGGFASLYDGFPGGGQLLHIIKGGPGTGKSGFMKRIRGEARARGMDTVSILCSGDPDSLDGLLVPELGAAWVDGTAPHVREPEVYGVDADYVNLGRFCRPLSREQRAQALSLARSYKRPYAAAYQLLSAAAALEAGEQTADEAVCREEEEEALALLEGLPARVGNGCIRQRFFLSAISCKGLLCLDETLVALCKRIVVLRGGPKVLRRVAELAEQKCARVILCPRPLVPGELEAVLLPEHSLAFLRAEAPLPVPRGERALSRQALELAVQELRDAKALHDRLEAVYRPCMDFEALTAFTDACVEELFGGAAG